MTFFNLNLPLVFSHRHADAIYLHLSSDLYLVPRTLLLHKLSAYGLSDDYVIWLRSYLTSRYFVVRIQ
jgi:hypothetical protein